LPGFDFGTITPASRPGEGGALQAYPAQAQRYRRQFRPSLAGRRRAARS